MNLESLQRLVTVPLFPLGPQSFSLQWVLEVLLLLVAVSLAARLLKRLLAGRVLPWFSMPEGRRADSKCVTGVLASAASMS